MLFLSVLIYIFIEKIDAVVWSEDMEVVSLTMTMEPKIEGENSMRIDIKCKAITIALDLNFKIWIFLEFLGK